MPVAAAMELAQRRNLIVLMFPWLAHGHIAPYLELAKRLTATAVEGDGCRLTDVFVYLVSTPVNLFAIAGHQTTKLRLVELHLPPLPGLLSRDLHTTKNLPADLMPTLKSAFDIAAPQFGALLDMFRPDVLLYDFLQPWAALEAEDRGIPAVHLSTTSAAATGFFVHCLQNARVPTAFPFEAISLGGPEEDAKYTALLAGGLEGDGGTSVMPDGERLLRSLTRSTEFVAVKTSEEIERKFMDYLSKLIGKEIVPCGPLLSVSEPGRQYPRVMRWLEGRDPGSVVLASVGSEYFMSERQMSELERGLELSDASFILVVRSPKNQDGEAALPRGLAPAKGLVVEGWAPQRWILEHRSCGAFLTHCGWSSVLEAMAAGVPMVALPLHIDQPLNANLAAEVGTALRVPQERFGEFKGEDVARVVRGVLWGEEGAAVRRRAKEVAEVVLGKNGERQRIAELVERMAVLCGKGQAAEAAEQSEAQSERSAVIN